MEINHLDFGKYLQTLSFTQNGDRFEREYGSYISEYFPKCEEFWRNFIVPSTKRIEGYPVEIGNSIKFRPEVAPEIQDIGSLHYSMFLHLVFAHIQLEKKEISSLENIYTRLGSTCDLAETVIEKIYFLILKCQDRASRVLQELDRDEFLLIAGKHYDDHYHELYKHYLSRGKKASIDLPAREDILVEYLGKESEQRKAYVREAQIIRRFRNVIVHDVRVAKIITTGDQTLIPRPKLINDYRTWRDVSSVIGNHEKIESDFVEQYQQAKEDIISLERVLNDLWNKLIDDFINEFYSTERTKIREMFDITISVNPVFGSGGKEGKGNSREEKVRPSGVYTGGSALFSLPTDKKDL